MASPNAARGPSLPANNPGDEFRAPLSRASTSFSRHDSLRSLRNHRWDQRCKWLCCIIVAVLLVYIFFQFLLAPLLNSVLAPLVKHVRDMTDAEAFLFLTLWIGVGPTVFWSPGTGVYLAGNRFGFARGLAVGGFASLVGPGIPFLLGRHCCARWVRRRVEKRPKLMVALRLVEERPFWGCFLVRWVALPYTWVNYGLSVAEPLQGCRGFFVYLVASWSARLVFLANNTYVGSSLSPEDMLLKYRGEIPFTPTEWIVVFGVGVASSVVGWVLWQRVKRHMRSVDAREDAAFAAGHRLELTSDGLEMESVPMAPGAPGDDGDGCDGPKGDGGTDAVPRVAVDAYTPPPSPPKPAGGGKQGRAASEASAVSNV